MILDKDLHTKETLIKILSIQRELLEKIKELIKENPNDADLGEIVRKLYNKW